MWAVGLAGVLVAIAPAPAPGVTSSGGELYAFGSNYTGQLGNVTNSGTAARIRRRLSWGCPVLPDPWCRSPPATHSLAVTSTGQLYAFGSSFLGELGITTNSGLENPNPTPTLVPKDLASPLCRARPVRPAPRSAASPPASWATPGGQVPLAERWNR